MPFLVSSPPLAPLTYTRWGGSQITPSGLPNLLFPWRQGGSA